MYCTVKADREGGRPIELSVQKIDVNGYTAKQIAGDNYFIAPCLYYGFFTPGGRQSMTPPDGAKDVGSQYFILIYVVSLKYCSIMCFLSCRQYYPLILPRKRLCLFSTAFQLVRVIAD